MQKTAKSLLDKLRYAVPVNVSTSSLIIDQYVFKSWTVLNTTNQNNFFFFCLNNS